MQQEKKRSLKSFHKYIERYGVYAIKMELNGTTYFIVMTKNFKNDYKEPYIYFITDLDNAYAVLEHYGKRWSIECCFKHLKTNGFNLESMNFKDDKKIELMVGVVCVAYVLSVQEGLIAHLKKPIPIKKYRNGKSYLSISIFRKGLETIEQKIDNLTDFVLYVLNIMAAKQPIKLCNDLITHTIHKNVQ